MRIGRISAGFGLILLGTLLLVLPGPGLVTIAAGLVILAREFVWAQRMLDWFTAKFRIDRASATKRAGTPPSP